MVNPVLIPFLYKASAEINRAVYEAKVLQEACSVVILLGTHFTAPVPQLESCTLCRVLEAVLKKTTVN